MTRPPSHRARRAAVAAALAAAAVLAGCSGDEPVAPATPTPSASTSAPTASTAGTSTSTYAPTASASPPEAEVVPSVADLYRDTRTAALSAASGHVVGSQTREGRTLTIDVEGVANGSNQTVFITTPTGTAQVLTVGEDYWLGGDEDFWVEQTGDATAGAGMVGRYVPITESDATELGSFTLRSILTEKFALPAFAAFESDTTPAEATEVDGRAAYVLGEEGGARMWVAADGSAALLRAVGPRTAPSDLVFSDWGRAQTFSPPPPSKVVSEG